MPAKKGNQYAKGNKGGRPTKFKPAYCKMLIDFFDKEPHKLIAVAKSEAFNKSGKKNFEKTEWKRVPNELPTLFRFAKSIGVDYTTITRWSKENKEFCNAYETAKELYKQFLITNGLEGLYQSQFAKFVAINTTDMKEKVEVSGNIGFSNNELDEYK